MEMFSKKVNDEVADLVRQVDDVRKKHNVGQPGPGGTHCEHPISSRAQMLKEHPKCQAEIEVIEAKIFKVRGGRTAIHTGHGPAIGPPVAGSVVEEPGLLE